VAQLCQLLAYSRLSACQLYEQISPHDALARTFTMLMRRSGGAILRPLPGPCPVLHRASHRRALWCLAPHLNDRQLASPHHVPVQALTNYPAAPADTPSPYASAVILVSALYHGSAAFYSYMRFGDAGQTGFLLGCGGSSALAVMGLWCLMFAGSGHISRRTGADKRTSGFIFKNTEADRRKKGKEL
jgi:hypothetical protein